MRHRLAIERAEGAAHVMMEKPPALSEAECLELIHHADRVDRIPMVASPMRSHPLVVELERLLDSHQLGEVRAGG